MPPGQYEGYITIQGSSSSVVTRVAYWYAVASDQPHYITLLSAGTIGSGRSREGVVIFRVTDESGLPVSDATPTATVVSGSGQVVDVEWIDDEIPNAFGLVVALGIRSGTNVVRIHAGDVTKDVTISGQ